MEDSTKQAGKKFIPLENNPTVMTSLAHRLGLSSKLEFHDVLSLTDVDLLSFIPRPVYALLVIMPATTTWRAYRTAEEATLPAYTGSGSDEDVFWIRQTIGNACGLIGLIHICANLPNNFIQQGSTMERFLKDATPLAPEPRAQLLYDSEDFEAAHGQAAVLGDSTVPDIDEEDHWGHFIAFVKGKNGHLYECEGARKGPVDRGQLGEDEDLLSPNALEMGVKSLLRIDGTSEEGNLLQFSCVALAPASEE